MTKQHETKAGIPCLEVLVSKRAIDAGLYATLSLYSLENRPVRKNLDIHHSDIFHFMVFDWDRSLKILLQDHNVNFSVVQKFFVTDLSDPVEEEALSFEDQKAWLKAAVKVAGQEVKEPSVNESSLII